MHTLSLSRSQPGRTARGLSVLAVTFLAFSTLDFLLTWCLLGTPGGGVYEANPIAARLLTAFGWLGLAAYKVACLSVVLGAVATLRLWRPAIARRVLVLGCVVLGGVVGYSAVLLHETSPNREERILLEHERARSRNLREEFEKSQLFIQKTNDLAEAMACHGLPLDQAVTQLKGYLATIEYDPLPLLRKFTRLENDQAALAAKLVRHVGFVVQENPNLPVTPLPQLASAFEHQFQCQLPHFAVETYIPDSDL